MQRTAFSVVVLVTLGVAGVFGLLVLLMVLQPGFMGMRHFSEHHHRVHDLTFAFLLGTAVVGMLAQIRAPLRNVGGQLMALTPFVALTLTVVLTNKAVLSPPWLVVGAFTLLATTLHPTGRDLFRAFSASRVNRVMLALVAIAALPLLAFASTNIGLQRSAGDNHAAAGHYGFMAAVSLTVIAVGLLASLRPIGWRLTAWVAGLLPALLGVASVVFPDVASSLSLVWAVAAIGWGLVFVAAAELAQDARVADRAPTPAPASAATWGGIADRSSSTPMWAMVSGIIIVVLILLFVVMHLAGGGPGLHGPSSARIFK